MSSRTSAGNAWWAIAAARAAGADGDPDEAYREALTLLGEHGTVRELAALLRAYGRYLRETGREREALDVFERAAEVAANLQGEPTPADRLRQADAPRGEPPAGEATVPRC